MGECDGYTLQQALCWPVKDYDDDQPIVCLYLKKLDTSHDNEPSTRKDQSEDIDELKKKIEKYEQPKCITLLFIEKPEKPDANRLPEP